MVRLWGPTKFASNGKSCNDMMGEVRDRYLQGVKNIDDVRNKRMRLLFKQREYKMNQLIRMNRMSKVDCIKDLPSRVTQLAKLKDIQSRHEERLSLQSTKREFQMKKRALAEEKKREKGVKAQVRAANKAAMDAMSPAEKKAFRLAKKAAKNVVKKARKKRRTELEMLA